MRLPSPLHQPPPPQPLPPLTFRLAKTQASTRGQSYIVFLTPDAVLVNIFQGPGGRQCGLTSVLHLDKARAALLALGRRGALIAEGSLGAVVLHTCRRQKKTQGRPCITVRCHSTTMSLMTSSTYPLLHPHSHTHTQGQEYLQSFHIPTPATPCNSYIVHKSFKGCPHHWSCLATMCIHPARDRPSHPTTLTLTLQPSTSHPHPPTLSSPPSLPHPHTHLSHLSSKADASRHHPHSIMMSWQL